MKSVIVDPQSLASFNIDPGKFSKVVLHSEHVLSLDKARLEALVQLKEQCLITKTQLEFSDNVFKERERIVDWAAESGHLLFTSDSRLVKLGELRGVEVLKPTLKRLEDYFDSDTMSIHLKEGEYCLAKKGKPGDWTISRISKERLTAASIQMHMDAVLAVSLPESEREGSIIVQHGPYRVAFTRPPLTDGYEITAVRPVRLLDLEEYGLDKRILERLAQAEGLLIAGSPGHGKTTFARAIGISYHKQGKIVKTVESPRDLQLPKSITQISLSKGSHDEIRDILLLSRPDYTLFDEMRNPSEFSLFADLRLSGIGAVGVVHATGAIDAIQRFIGKMELGLIPNIVDTVLFIHNGQLEKAYTLDVRVKVPKGMADNDLARPVIVVNDFLTGKDLYEIYTYGDAPYVIPVDSVEPSRSEISVAIQKALPGSSIQHMDDKHVRVISRSDADNTVIRSLEEEFNIKVTSEKIKTRSKTMSFSVNEDDRYVALMLEEPSEGDELEIYVEDTFLMNAKVSKRNMIRVSKDSKSGLILSSAFAGKRKVVLRNQKIF